MGVLTNVGSALLAGACALTLGACADAPAPAHAAAGHPRLLITRADVGRLRSWATPRNPMYARGLARLARSAKADMDAGRVPGQDTGSDAYDEFTTEQYAELFAFMSLIERRPSVRGDYGHRARRLLMHELRIAARGAGGDDEPFRDPAFATYDRSRWNGEAFALTVDWAYPYFTRADKRIVREVFLRWSREQFRAYPLDQVEGARPRPGGKAGDPALVANRRSVRLSLNNYSLAHARNLGLMALALDRRDDPGGRLRRYAADVTGQWLFVVDHALATDAQGGLSPEGFEYGPEALGRLAQLLRALHTAGRDGGHDRLATDPFWPATITAFLSSLPTRPTRLDGDHAYLGDVFQPAWFGDAQDYWAGDPITLFGPLALAAVARGDRSTVDAVRWIEADVPPGGRTALYDRAGHTDQFFAAILYFLLFEPGAPAPADPRPEIPTHFFAPGLGRTVARTCWCDEERIFTHKLSWNAIDHQVGDGNDFGLFRDGEWLTRQRAMYAGGFSDYKNVVAVQNDAPEHDDPDDPRHRIGETGGQWDADPAGDPELVARSSGDGYLALTGDATNLYNSTYEGVTDVRHASRSIVWLQPDRVVVYDRAATGKEDRFKRFWLQLPSAPELLGDGRAVAHTARGQQLFVTSLLPDGAAMSGSSDADEGEPAEGDPMTHRLMVESRERDARFLTVLQGADAGAAGDAVTRLASAEGTAYDGAAVAGQAVLFRRDLGEAFERVAVDLPNGVRRVVVTGLEPGDEYAASVRDGRLSAGPGSGDRADAGGVLVVEA